MEATDKGAGIGPSEPSCDLLTQCTSDWVPNLQGFSTNSRSPHSAHCLPSFRLRLRSFSAGATGQGHHHGWVNSLQSRVFLCCCFRGSVLSRGLIKPHWRAVQLQKAHWYLAVNKSPHFKNSAVSNMLNAKIIGELRCVKWFWLNASILWHCSWYSTATKYSWSTQSYEHCTLHSFPWDRGRIAPKHLRKTAVLQEELHSVSPFGPFVTFSEWFLFRVKHYLHEFNLVDRLQRNLH